MQGRSFVRNGITILSGYDPVRRCEAVADAVPVKDRTLYFCPSPVYGWGLGKFLSRLETQASNSRILCVEADPELYGISMKETEPSVSANDKLRITNITEAGSLCAFIRECWGTMAFRRVEMIKFTGGWQLFAQLYNSLFETIRREIARDWSNTLTLAKLGRLYARNTLRNLSLIPRFPSVKNLSFGSSPVLVLGAGPSLDETLDEIERRFGENLRCGDRNAFKIVCADTCLGALKDRNIKPDLVVILESQHWNLNDFTGCAGWNVQIAADLCSLPQSLRILGGKGFLFSTLWTPLKIFERLKKESLLPAVFPPLGSVGLTAVEIARRLTTGKILCAGLDFSFTKDKYHARSTPGHRALLNSQNRFYRIFNRAAYSQHSAAAVSKSSLSVYVNPAMKNYRDLFEQEFGGDPRIFDIESSGLPLGIKTLLMEDAMNLLDKNSLPAENQSEVNAVFSAGDLDNSQIILFCKNEKKRLEELRSLLTGETPADNERLNILIDECDYLWAHFPDSYAVRRFDFTQAQAESENKLSFLKRVRAEIDPMLKILESGTV